MAFEIPTPWVSSLHHSGVFLGIRTKRGQEHLWLSWVRSHCWIETSWDSILRCANWDLFQFPLEQGIRMSQIWQERVPWDLDGRTELGKQSVHWTNNDQAPATRVSSVWCCATQRSYNLVSALKKLVKPIAKHMNRCLKIQIVLYFVCQMS